MSRYDWIDITWLNDPKAALLCARLYLRSGKRRLRAGYSRAGIAALYDAVLFGMRYYIARHKRCESLVENTDPWDAPGLCHALARAGVFEDPLLLNRFSLTVERALWEEAYSIDSESMLAEVEKILLKLGVIPAREQPPS